MFGLFFCKENKLISKYPKRRDGYSMNMENVLNFFSTLRPKFRTHRVLFKLYLDFIVSLSLRAK